jgi:hypothetical protein
MAVDLSFNRITGRYREIDNVSNSVVTLEVNRLSGALPGAAAFTMVKELKILRDNLFGCESIPGQDEYSEDFSCGSQYLDVALYVFAGIMFPFIYSLFLIFLMKKLCDDRDCLFVSKAWAIYAHQRRRFDMFSADALPSLHAEELVKVYKLHRNLRSIALKFILILALVVLVNIPVYTLKMWEYGLEGDALYSTHSYTYGWMLSVAYVTGNLPASLLLFGWVSVFSFCYFLLAQKSADIALFPTCCNQDQGSSRDASCHVDGRESVVRDDGNNMNNNDITRGDITSRIFYALLFLGNVAIVACVNILYVISTFEAMTPTEHLLTQIGVATFKFIYNGIMLHKLLAWLTATEESNIKTQLILSIFNKIIIPCVVTAFTSPSCFQSLIVEPDDIMSAYTYDFCSVVSVDADGMQGSCLQYSVQEVDVIPMTPPFIYNNLCSSVLLTTYIPVYVFMFSFQILVPILVMFVFSRVDYFLVRVQWRQVTHGILWPAHWSKHDGGHVHASAAKTAGTNDHEEASQCASASSLVKSVDFQLSIMNHLMILLTFGFCSPFLGFILVTSLLVEIYLMMLLVSRFVEHRVGTMDLSGVLEVDDHALVVLGQVQIRIARIFSHCVWPLLASSALFFAFISWDMSSDASDWKKGSWAPMLSISTLLVARIGSLCYYQLFVSGRNINDDEVAMIAMNAMNVSDL